MAASHQHPRLTNQAKAKHYMYSNTLAGGEAEKSVKINSAYFVCHLDWAQVLLPMPKPSDTTKN